MSEPTYLPQFPRPWSFDSFPHAAQRFSSAALYAADSTCICQTTGAHAESLARLIVDAVNAYPLPPLVLVLAAPDPRS